MQQLPIDPNFVQKLSLPIELFGFTLLIIELFFNRFVEYLESNIDKLELASERTIISLRNWGVLGILFKKYRKYDPDLIGKSPKIHIIVFVYSTCVSLLIALASIIWLIFSFNVLTGIISIIILILLFKYYPYPINLFGQICLLLSLIPMFLLTFIFGKIFRLMNLIGRGKAFGAVGIILSIVGLLGECYQVYCIEIGLKEDTNYFSSLFVHLTLMLLFILWARKVSITKSASLQIDDSKN